MAWTKCVTCETEINDNQEFCESCGSAQPKRSSGGASLLQRFVGRLIDVVTQAIAMVPVSLLLLNRMGGIEGVRHMLEGMRNGQPLMLSMLIRSFVATQAVFLLLNGYLLSKKGQTIGKLAMGTRIVDMEGKLPDAGKSIGLRYVVVNLIGSIPFVGGLFTLVDCLFVFAKDRRCLHDHIAGTRVVEA